MRRCAWGMGLLGLLYGLYACYTNPVTGEKELSLLSPEDEIRLGAQADKSIVAQYGLYDDEQLAEYIDQIGQRMVKVSHRPDLKFHFRLLDSPVINAFALPGGYTYITRGILAYMNSEAELAGVIGHEIGHVTARHGAKAYTRAQLAQLGLGIGSILSEDFRRFSDVAEVGVGLLFLKFSRDQERQSDRLGVEYATKIGYDASHLSHFFGTLNRLQGESGESLPGWFSTHPNPEEREAKVLELAREWQQKVATQDFTVARDRYLDHIDGIVYGEDPRQGFVENDYFYHPELEFQFPVPEKWRVINTPQQVQIISPEQDAGIVLSLSDAGDARLAAQKFVTDNEARVLQSDRTTVNGMPAEVRVSEVAGQQGTLRVLSYFIEKGAQVYVFHGFSAAGQYSSYEGAFRYTMGNFDRLKNRAAKQVKPTRIRVVRVDRRATLETLLANYGMKDEQHEELAVINGLQLTDTLTPGQRIKILRE